MAKKLTAQQRDIQRLTKQYQENLSALSPEYEGAFSQNKEAMSGYEAQSQAFQKRLEDYQKSLAEYKANPMTQIGYLKPVKKSRDYSFTDSGQTKYLSQINDNDYFVEGLTVYKKTPKPTFTEEPPTAPETTERDAALANVEEQRKTLGQEFQREIGERRASRVSAVSRRSQSRPMLSKGVAL